MPLRTLQPAPSRRKPAARVESSSESPQTPASYRPAAVQACLDCRRLKIKCDGTWPKCSTCTAKNRTCGYVGQEGQSRATAVRSRLEYLEEVVAALKTSNPDQLDAIVQGIRTAEDPAGVSGLSSNGPTTPDQQHRQSNMLLLANKLVSDFRLLLPEPPLVQQAVNSFFSCSGKLFHVFSEDYIAQCYRAVFDEPQASSENLKSKVCTLAAVAAVGAQYTPDAIDKESELGLYNLSRHFIEVAMEHEPLHAIKICALFAQYNIMSKEMIALTYVETGLSMCHIYGINNRALRPDHIPSMEWSDLRKTWRTLIFFSSWLSSTLGYISGNAWSAEKRVLMDLKVEDPMDITEAVQTEMARICLLKAEILRMHMVFKDLTSPAVEAIRKDLQGWYDELPELLRLEATAHESLPVGIKRSILHLHMLYLGAIMLLYRRVATMFLQSYANGGPSYSLHLHPLQAFAQQSTEAILAATTSARIVKLLLEDEGVFKHCWLVIFQTYTTCTILLHSVVQKQLHNFPPSAWEDDLEKARDCLSVLAFCGSQDRVASQFHGQLKRVFQAVIAYGSSSVPENGFEEMEVEQETTQSHSTFSAMDEGAGQPQPADHAYLLDIPVDADPSHIHLSCYLLMMLSQPFGDLSMKEATEVNMRQHWLADPLRYEYPQMAARLVDWNLEDKHMFQWDLGKLNIPHLSLMETSKEPSTSEDSTDSGLSSNRSWGTFLGSTEPSGWGSAASLTSSVSNRK